MNAGDGLWIISGHDHGGYAQTFYGGYAHHSHGQAPPSNGYGYASTFCGGYASLRYGYDPPNKCFPPLVKN